MVLSRRKRIGLFAGLMSIASVLCSAPVRAQTALLEEPPTDSFRSGIGFIRGWRCELANIQVDIDGTILLTAVYGMSRPDTFEVCGDEKNGWGVIINYNTLSDGIHTIRALANGVEFGSATFTVTTIDGAGFLTGASGRCVLQGFPESDGVVALQWDQSAQNFFIAGFSRNGAASCDALGNPTYTCTCTASACGGCGIDGDPNTVHENVPCTSALDICQYADGLCVNPDLPGCDGSRIFVHGWTCVPNREG